MTASPEFETATARDLVAVRNMLATAGLPYADVEANTLRDFILLRDPADRITAIGGIEAFDSDGLLRSVVVDEQARGGGLGKKLTKSLEQRAREKGISALYLLTTTAADFFPRLGYERFDRARVPVSISQSAEFSTLCPASAVCMRKLLA